MVWIDASLLLSIDVYKRQDEAYAVKVEPKPYAALVEEMAEGIAFLIENKEKRIEMGKIAYERMNEAYLYRNKCQWLLEQYEKIMRG